ncbi:MAG: TerB family tellurite resistance protein [Burkholderiales bacterium]|nr:MAG: TerB family tellurite resistance protein [Burkholderiales bacterium]
MTTSSNALRIYTPDSSEAAARVVALALIADGRMQSVETRTLDALRAPERLGLTRLQWHGVIEHLCEDLAGPARRGDESCISDEVLHQVLDEVQDESVRRAVLHLCSAVVHADRSIDEAESFVLLAAVERWGLQPDTRALLKPKRITAKTRATS